MKTLIWSVAWGEYRYMMQSMMNSIKASGSECDLMVFCDEPLSEVLSLEMDLKIEMDFKQYWKFRYLPKLAELEYDLFVFIDSDHYFVRKPPKSFSEIIGDDPWHSFLESPINAPDTRRGDWWGVPNQRMAEIYRGFGVTQNRIYSTNGGFWMCKRDFLVNASSVGLMFRDYQKPFGFDLPEEVAIAVMSHMFGRDYSDRFHSNYMDVWASEWTGALKDRIPDGNPWRFQEYMTGRVSEVNPAIVHAMRSKSALVSLGKSVFEETKYTRKFSTWAEAKSKSRKVEL